MAETFDPYYKWLAIAPEDQPPDLYQLVGVRTFEDDPDVIENASDQRMVHLRTFQSGKHSEDSQNLLNEVAAAKIILLDPEKKPGYDATLREQMRIRAEGKDDEEISSQLIGFLRAVELDKELAAKPAKRAPQKSKTSNKSKKSEKHKEPKETGVPAGQSKRTLVSAAVGCALVLLIIVGIIVLASRGPQAGTIVFPEDFSSTDGITLLIDDEEVPLPAEGVPEYEYPSGKHKICVTRPGHQPFLQEVTVAPGKEIEVSVSWKPEASIVLLWPSDERKDAELQLDGRVCDAKAEATESTPATITLPVSAGQHEIEITRKGHEPFEAKFIVSTGERRKIPTGWVPLRPEDGHGLLGEYFAGRNFDRKVLTRYDRKLFFYWSPSPDGRVPSDNFSARWTGWLKPPEAGQYTFTAWVDDGIRLWLDGKLLIDHWRLDSCHPHRIPVELTQEPHPIKIEYVEYGAGAILCFNWASPGKFSEQPVLSEFLFCDQVTAQVASPKPVRNSIRGTAQSFDGTWVKGVPVDLLPLVDLRLDILRGPWWFEDDALSSGKEGTCLIQTPVAPPQEYEIELTAERAMGKDALSILLPTSGNGIEVCLDGYKGQYSGLARVDGVGYNENETRYAGPLFTNGEPANVRCRVQKDGISVSCNGTKIIDWRGDYSRCGRHKECAGVDPRYLVLGSWSSVFRISKFELTPLTSEKRETVVPVAGPVAATSKPPETAPAAAATAAEERQPVPSQADQAATAKLIDETYHPEKLTTASQKVELGRQLLDLGKKSEGNPAEQFALLRKAAELARDGGDAGTMLAAIDVMGKEFEIALLNLKGQLIVQFAKEGKELAAVRSLTEHVSPVIDEALAAGRPDAARAIVDAAYDMATRLRSTTYRKRLHQQRQEVLKVYQLWVRCRQALAALAKNPDHPEANLEVGRYRCFIEGKWEEGLPLLAKGNNPTLQAIAKQESANPQDATSQVALADAWWAAAGSEPKDVQPALKQRAGEWYERAIPQITSVLVRDKCRKRFEEAAKIAPKAAPDDVAQRTQPAETGPAGPEKPAPDSPSAGEAAGYFVPSDAEEFGGHRYRVFNAQLTWHDAAEFCEKYGGYLARIESEEERQFVVGLASSRNVDRCWIDGNDELREGVWKYGNGVTPSFLKWSDRNPNNDSQAEHCLELNKSWMNDCFNGVRHAFACEWEARPEVIPKPPRKPKPRGAVRFGTSSYARFDVPATWHTAKTLCESMGGHLARIESPQENRFVYQLIAGKKSWHWLDGTDAAVESVWHFTNGEQITYFNWGQQQPNTGGRCHYLGMHPSSGDWGAGGAGNRYGFVCEWDNAPPKKLEKPPGPVDLKTGLVLKMSFDQGSFFEQGGQTYVRDESGKGNHGKIIGARPAEGRNSGALVFDAAKGYRVQVPSNPELSGGPTAKLTVAGWFIGNGDIATKFTGPNAKDWGLQCRDCVVFHSETGGNFYVAGGCAMVDFWHHAAFVLDQADRNLRLYLDGELVYERTNLGNVSAPTGAPVRIGGSTYGNRDQGKLDNVVIYNRCLSQAEIRALMGEKPSADAKSSPKPAVDPTGNTPPATSGASREQASLPKELSIDLPGGVKMEFVLVPAGEFVMGSPEPERQMALEQAKAHNDKWVIERIPTEGPQHKVKITKPFYLGKYEVAQAQWEAVMGNNPSQFKGPLNPVEKVGWDDIQQFLAKMSRVRLSESQIHDTECRATLPTEAQWEYACRAGTTTTFYFGDNPALLPQHGWYKDNSGGKTHPVGQGKPNAWGLYNMHGNVWEWCSDWCGKDFYEQSPPVDPVGPPTGSSRVLRGGGWLTHPEGCRSAFRNDGSPGYRGHGVGFRVTLVLSGK